MKKFLALIVACVTVASSYAATVMYSSVEFKAAIPVLMKGTLKVNSWEVADCALDKGKASFPVYLAFCQPCINCVTCQSVSETLTNVQLYVVEKDTKAKAVYLTAVDLADLDVLFTTGNDGTAKKGDVKVDMPAQTQDNYGDIASFFLTGVWNLKTWFSGIDSDTGGQKYKVVLGGIQQLVGNVSANNATEDSWACGTLALRRDDSVTKKLMLLMTDYTNGSTASNPFLVCGNAVTPEFDTCVDVMTLNKDDDTVVAADLESSVGQYILKKSLPKNYKLVVNGTEVSE
ncbi:MAG: hypothetical protein WCT05_10150 [Lentisphaeria bacterium]